MSLKERSDVVALHRSSAASGGVLLSLVDVSGASHGKPGARLLVTDEGNTAGSLSGGYVGLDLLRRAAWLVRSGAVMECFTVSDGTAETPYGPGCDVLLEPTGTAEANALLGAMEATLAGLPRVVATCLPGRGTLTRIVMDLDGDVLFASDALPTEEIVDLRYAARRGSHASRHRVGLHDVFVEHLHPM